MSDGDHNPLPLPLAAVPKAISLAASLALVITIASVILGRTPGWFYALPIVVGVGFAVMLFLRDCGEPEALVEETPPIAPVRAFPSDFWLHLRQKPSEGERQMGLFEKIVPEQNLRRRLHKLISSKGGDPLFVVDAQRFQELLVTGVITDLDKATEHALAVTWHRFGGQVQPELRALLHKSVREIIISDIRGNVVQMFASVGEAVLSDLVKQAEEVKADEKAESEVFELKPVPVRSPRRSKAASPKVTA